MERLTIAVAVFCIFVIVPINVFASHPVITDDVGIVPTEKYELEIGYYNFGGSGFSRSHSGDIALKYGVSKKMDIGFIVPIRIESREEGAEGGVIIGFKFGLIEDILSVSMSNEPGSMEYFVNGIISYKLAKTAIHFNIGYRLGNEDKTLNELVYSFAAEHPVSRFDILGEACFCSNEGITWHSGIRYNISEIISVGIAIDSNTQFIFGFHSEF